MTDPSLDKMTQAALPKGKGSGTGLLETPILFTVFNRPETTRRVFDSIRDARPSRLYVACDGPRHSVPRDSEAVASVRSIVGDVDWPCSVMTLFQEQNLGCRQAMNAAIDWFFSHEESGIILEDDCLPHPSFYEFCASMLSRYASDERVWMVTGDNFQYGVVRGEASYYFSRYIHVWGWATWRRSWSMHDKEMSFWPRYRRSDEWSCFWTDEETRRFWEEKFDMVYRSEIDTWDYQWIATVWMHGGLTATPNVNLVSNIGFGNDATHTTRKRKYLTELPTGSLGEVRHPVEVAWNCEADDFVFKNVFKPRKSALRRMLSWLYRRFA